MGPVRRPAIDPVLSGVPLGYILYNLKDIGPKLSEGAKATQAIPPTGPLHSEMLVKFNNTDLEPPTHILAVHSKQQNGLFTLYPVHALVVSTGCAHLPLLPDSPAIPPGAAMPELTLPVVSLSIPSPSMFQPILNYLYMRQNDVILDVLLPIEDNEVDPFIEMSKKQAEQFSVKELLINARKIWGLWANASALGIFDDHLFTTMEIAWEICIGALNISLDKPLDSGVDVPPED
ncbi:hypothetical protein Clacol_009008 [Clathrus columnatus]|uniref:Uncharacterized protein n=1 Tax=Clathrus columnatus TaxID=1419009 RepID=A0AAV5APC3_9AGAM|nr:hypothetical protein Clacol_009008 [Clathrus columnatus]